MSSAENSKLFASPVALSKVEKGRKSTFFSSNNLLLFLLKITVVGVHIAAVNLAEQPAERKNQEQAPHLTCLFLYKRWWHIASPPFGNQRNILVCFIWRQSHEATGARWTEVLFGRGALEDWKTGTKYYLEEVQADRQTKDPSGHRRFDFWEVSTSSIVNRREPGGILLKNSQIWNNLFGIKIKTSSWVFCCENSYSSR